MSQVVFGIHAVRALVDKRADAIEYLLIQSHARNPRIQEIEQIARKNGVPVRLADKDELEQMAQGGNHQGIVAVAFEEGKTYKEEDISGLLADLSEPAFILVLDGIQDPHNLGACLRTANAAGAHMVIAPKDKSVGLTATVRKIACGAAETTPFIQVTNLARTLGQLKEAGIWVTGTDADTDQTLYDMDFTGATAIVIGNEGSGMRRLTRESCDFLAKIPMNGTVESLNASVATAICLYEVRRQRVGKG